MSARATNLNPTYLRMIADAHPAYDAEMKVHREAFQVARCLAAKTEAGRIAEAKRWLSANDPASLPRLRPDTPFTPSMKPTASPAIPMRDLTRGLTLTNAICGDPPVGRSALDQREARG